MADSREFEAFVRDYQNMVFTLAMRLTGSAADAQDLTQEVFLQAWKHFDALRTSPTRGGWLKTTTRNRCINHLQRYRSRWRFFSELVQRDDSGSEQAEPDLPLEAASPAQVTRGDLGEVVEQALLQLPEKQRIPLVLYHYEDLPYDEIARLLGASLSKVKTDIARGRERLKDLLADAAAAGHLN